VLPWKQLKIQLSNGDWVDIQMTQVKESKKFDLSIINLTKDLPSQFKPLQFAKETPELGESICGIGYPLTYSQIAFDGHLTGVYSTYWMTNAVINPGH
ncbi:hypothetical protein ACI394_27920, partial [Klebsiella pneumoniae]|uniref:hypothetical protein n=1 Tax=Klebsiella pneumoniae TaxID=573 RepID=UPI0038539861